MIDIASVHSDCGGDDGTDCGGDEGTECGGDEGADGKSTIVELTASISRNHAEDIKAFRITIPWGWGRNIIIEEL